MRERGKKESNFITMYLIIVIDWITHAASVYHIYAMILIFFCFVFLLVCVATAIICEKYMVKKKNEGRRLLTDLSRAKF